MRNFILICALAVFLGGCSTVPSKSAAIPEAGPDAAKIVFLCAPLSPPHSVKGTLSVDGIARAVLPAQSYTWIMVAPGRHVIKFSRSIWSAIPSRTLTVDLRKHAVRYFVYSDTITSRVGIAVPLVAVIHPHLVEISAKRAKELLPQCFGVRPIGE